VDDTVEFDVEIEFDVDVEFDVVVDVYNVLEYVLTVDGIDLNE